MKGIENEATAASQVRTRSERNGARGLEFEGFAKAIEGLGNG